MAEKTEFLGLALTDRSETTKPFLEWRTLINGTEDDSNMQIIDRAMKELSDSVGDLLYEEIAITSFTNTVTTAEMGSTVDSVTLNWETSKEPTELALDGATVTGSSIAITEAGITANKTWTLSATDERDFTATAKTSITFYNRVCYGASADGTYDSDFINALANRILSGTKARTFTVNAGDGQYIFYAIPTRLGTPAFNVGGFDGGFTKVASAVNCTNASGYTETYDIWRSDNAGLGSTTVKVV